MTTRILRQSILDEHQAQKRLTRLLTAHSSRTRVPVLVGDGVACVAAWRRWAASVNTVSAVVKASTQSELFRGWCECVVNSTDLNAASLEKLAGLCGLPLARLKRDVPEMSDFRLTQLFSQAKLSGQPMLDRILRVVLDAARCDTQLTATALLDVIVSCRPSEDVDFGAAIESIQEILGLERCPGLLCLCDGDDRKLRQSLEFGLQNPTLNLGLTLSEETYSSWLAATPDSFTKAVMQDAVIVVGGDFQNPPHERGRISEEPDSARRSVAGFEETTRLLRHLPDSDDLVQQAARINTVDIGKLKSAPEIANARSQAEAFLFQVLNKHAETTGLFQLNVKGDFRFGTSAVEIDLACPNLRIAIEVDGYFHFLNSESYRRDRRKDVLLQQHGFLILRFLAEDVVPQLPEIIETVISSIRWRRQLNSEMHPEQKTRKAK